MCTWLFSCPCAHLDGGSGYRSSSSQHYLYTSINRDMSRRDREQLAHWRNINARRSVDVLEIGSRVLKAGGLGDEEWSVREQLAFAALDMGALGLAEVGPPCTLSRLTQPSRVTKLIRPVTDQDPQTEVSKIAARLHPRRNAPGSAG